MKVSFLLTAQSEFEETIDYYDEQRTGLGLEFLAEVGQALERISHYPEAWSQLSSRIRRCLVNRFPYSVIYEVRSELLIIVAIQHHHRKPESWLTRVK
ncbi:MAG: type II toxin-antitoxin system RelE/ParE family toxin [Pyrinomonadaceae bacterium]|jgi:plasmid stabilization system protein ParE|nr:type II toxin-antitoxin system RelE/ParE family toxin [Pyrinomonadaceae bacterium]